MGVIFIIDPVAGTRYTLRPDSRTAVKNPAGVALRVASNGVGRGVVNLAINGGGQEEAQRFITTAVGGLATGPSNAKTEQLGNMFIEGVQAQGTRTTTTIPAGQIGNDRPINIVDERWYSPDLQMTIMTKHSDPRSGETNFALKSINRSAPPPTLFEVPSDYTVNTPADELQKAREDMLRKAGALK